MGDSEDELLEEAIRRGVPSRKGWYFFFVALVGGGAAIYFLLQQLDRTRLDLAAATQRAKDAELKDQDAEAKAGELMVQNEKLAGDKQDLAAQKELLEKDVQAKADELARLKGTYDELQQKMKAEIQKGDIRLTQAGGRLQVDLVDKILFDSGDATISKRGEGVLARIGAVLAQIEDKQIQVSGHTDDAPISPKLQGMYPTNWELSSARATNVVRFLTENAGVPGKRLFAAGFGPFHPIASNQTAQGRARNRRIEILLTPAIEPVPVKGKVKVAEVKPSKARARPKKK